MRLGCDILLHDTKKAAQKIKKENATRLDDDVEVESTLHRFSTLVQAEVASIHIGPRWQQGKSMKWAIWTLEVATKPWP